VQAEAYCTRDYITKYQTINYKSMQENDTEIYFQIGKETSEFVRIDIERYSYSNSDDFWDGNWLDVIIIIRVGAFSGRYKAQLRNADFLELKKGLEQLYKTLNGDAKFVSIENYLEIMIKGDGLGHFLCNCLAMDDPGIDGNRLDFKLAFDQTEIPEMIKSINKIIQNFPLKDMDK
jgi:hypothetical protein